VAEQSVPSTCGTALAPRNRGESDDGEEKYDDGEGDDDDVGDATMPAAHPPADEAADPAAHPAADHPAHPRGDPPDGIPDPQEPPSDEAHSRYVRLPNGSKSHNATVVATRNSHPTMSSDRLWRVMAGNRNATQIITNQGIFRPEDTDFQPDNVCRHGFIAWEDTDHEGNRMYRCGLVEKMVKTGTGATGRPTAITYVMPVSISAGNNNQLHLKVQELEEFNYQVPLPRGVFRNILQGIEVLSRYKLCDNVPIHVPFNVVRRAINMRTAIGGFRMPQADSLFMTSL
jgi:hypothetical protein